MIFIALGSNQGDRAATLAAARDSLARAGIGILRQSSVIETPAMLPEGAPLEWNIPYLNQVIEIDTSLSPEELLALLKSIEQALGRTDRGRWGPREIDLDLLAYHDVTMATPSLTLPHPGLCVRDFVLRPLAEIAPDWQPPGSDQSVRALLAGLA